MRQIVYRPAERPTVEVLVDGVWRYGNLRMWTQGPLGWTANVEWQPARWESYRLDTFHEHDVRPLRDISRYLPSRQRP